MPDSDESRALARMRARHGGSGPLGRGCAGKPAAVARPSTRISDADPGRSSVPPTWLGRRSHSNPSNLKSREFRDSRISVSAEDKRGSDKQAVACRATLACPGELDSEESRGGLGAGGGGGGGGGGGRRLSPVD